MKELREMIENSSLCHLCCSNVEECEREIEELKQAITALFEKKMEEKDKVIQAKYLIIDEQIEEIERLKKELK